MKKITTLLTLLGILMFNSALAQNQPQFAFQYRVRQNRQVCEAINDGRGVGCSAHVVTDDSGKPLATAGPTGLNPAAFHLAYSLPTTAATQQIIAIVDAYNDPTAKADLDTYSALFGLPILPTCSGAISASASPCFAKISQTGSTSVLPATNSGWSLEIALDTQMARAICQNCSLLLVESNSSSYSDLMKAVDEAVAQGAKIISNSYGSGEFFGESSYDSHFNKKGYAFTFSAGDSGFGASYPAASPYVTSVGGTTLHLDPTTGQYVSESVWSGTGSGCSALETKPSFQKDTGCSHRTIADVSADADPNTGASVYLSTPYSGQVGWFQVGGTSLGAPLIAAVYALSGGVPATVMGNSLPYAQKNYLSNLHDVTIGSNGPCNKKALYLCTAGSGYDGPTGLGTPNGPGAF